MIKNLNVKKLKNCLSCATCKYPDLRNHDEGFGIDNIDIKCNTCKNYSNWEFDELTNNKRFYYEYIEGRK